MRRLGCLAITTLAALSGCGGRFDTAPAASYPSVCEEQVYADPKVKDLILRGMGSDNLRRNTEDQLQAAKMDAAHRCMQQKGLTAPGGGVERPRVEG